MYVLVRGDLGLDNGQTSVQCGHAFLKAALKTQREEPKRFSEYLDESFVKVCLIAKNLESMHACKRALEGRGVHCEFFEDAGYPQFLGKTEVTTLGIGPCRKSEVGDILRRFQLLK